MAPTKKRGPGAFADYDKCHIFQTFFPKIEAPCILTPLDCIMGKGTFPEPMTGMVSRRNILFVREEFLPMEAV
jgi:hypothetical protein